MDRIEVTHQSSTSISLRGELSGDGATSPTALAQAGRFAPLNWALEGWGWDIIRPAADFVLLAVAVMIAVGGFDSFLHVSSLNAPLLALPPVAVILFYGRGLYRSRLRSSLLDGIVPVISGVSVATMTVAMVGLLANGHVPAQSIWIHSWLLGLLAVALARSVLSLLQRWARVRRLVGKPVLIVGAGMIGAQVGRRLDNHPEYGLVPVGFLDEDPRSVAEVGGRSIPVLGTDEDLDDIVQRTGIKNLIVAFSSVADARVSRLIQRCQELGIEVSVVPRMFDTINNRVRYDTVGGLPLLSFTAVDPNGLSFAVKHGLDRILALILLCVLSPILVCAALAVRLTSPGPAIFRQRRVGRDGKLFDLYKFRSMREDQSTADPGEGNGNAIEFLLGGDTAPGGVEGRDRRTAVGRLLRSTSVDELPQLLNVLRGDMSLVGPRPERPEFVELFRQDITRYGDRHRVKSGITGWAQVHGLRGQTSLAERVEWDNYYIGHWSIGLDVKILALTFVALFRSAE
jgi:exopolysaccharide biosynthesis polyprenyl glycosylphosphotransferase